MALLCAGVSAFTMVQPLAAQQPGPVTEPQAAPPAPDDKAADAEGDIGDISLDLDETMDAGVAWPDLDAKPAPEELAVPLVPAGAETDAGDALATIEDAQSDTSADTADGAEDYAPTEAMADDGSERRYRVELNGLNDEIEDDQFRSRFKSLSLLEERRGKSANLAQINRRMRLDADLLDRILRAKGYYDAVIRPSVRPAENGGDRVRVVFDIRPGQRYILSNVSLPGLARAAERAPALRTAFPIQAGTPVDADAIMAARQQLALGLGQNGFPFAVVEEPEVTVDHETRKGELEVVVRAGGYRRFGDIVLDDASARLMSARHLGRIARFDRGDVYQATDVEDLRQAIVATSLVSSVTVKPRDGTDGEHVDLAVAMTPAKMRTIAGEIGYGTGEGYRLAASWQHRNFFPPEGALAVRGLLGTKEQGAGVSFRRNNFLRRDHILTAALSARHQVLDAYKASTVTLSAGLERQTNIIFQKKWAWSIGAELVGSREKDIFAGRTTSGQRDYLIAALPGLIAYDGSDDLLNPTRGFRLSARISPEVARESGAFFYVRAQADGSLYVPVSDKVVLASRVRLGSILSGVDADRIAPSRRFYAGGGASVRGYGYQAIGPRDAANDPIGGKSLAEFSLEARVRLGRFGVVPFVDAGNISTRFLPRLSDVRYGAGVGLRYYSNFGPIRIDVGTPLNRQSGDGRIAVYVSLGQAF